MTPEWIQELIGQHFKAYDGRTYECLRWDPNAGLWMRTLDEPVRETCISERAIGRTFHRMR